MSRLRPGRSGGRQRAQASPGHPATADDRNTRLLREAYIRSLDTSFHCDQSNATIAKRLRKAKADLPEPDEHYVTASGGGAGSEDRGQPRAAQPAHERRCEDCDKHQRDGYVDRGNELEPCRSRIGAWGIGDGGYRSSAEVDAVEHALVQREDRDDGLDD